MNIKKRFAGERTTLENDKKRLHAQVEDLKNKLEHNEAKNYQMRKEIEDHPMSLLRAEIQQKNLEMQEMESKVTRKTEEK